MIRNGDQYRESLQDGREVFINGEQVKDVTTHPMFKPCLLYTSPSPRDRQKSRMPSSA